MTSTQTLSVFSKRPVSDRIREDEAARRAREQAIHIVKVVLPIGDTEAAVYREGRLGLKYQELSKEEMEMLGEENKGYFQARWSDTDIKWVLLSKASKEDFSW